MTLEEMKVLAEALTQYIENKAVLEEWETEPKEIAIAEKLLDNLNLQILEILK